MLQGVSVQFLIAHDRIQNPIEDLPLTTDGTFRSPFVEAGFHVLEAISRSDRCERLMSKTTPANMY